MYDCDRLISWGNGNETAAFVRCCLRMTPEVYHSTAERCHSISVFFFFPLNNGVILSEEHFLGGGLKMRARYKFDKNSLYRVCKREGFILVTGISRNFVEEKLRPNSMYSEYKPNIFLSARYILD